MAYTVTLPIGDMLKRFQDIGRALPRTVLAAATVASESMVADVVKNRMSGQYLGVVTGTARRSMTDRARIVAGVVQAEVGSPLVYVAAHEEGFHGIVQVPGHARRRLGAVLARDIKTRRVTKRGRISKAQRARWGMSSIIYVRPHKMRMNVRARHFVRDTVRAAVEPTRGWVANAIRFAAMNGRVPTTSDILSGN